MGAYSKEYTVSALSKGHLDALFKFNIDVHIIDEQAHKPNVVKALNELDASKWGHAQAIRYIKQGTTKRQLDGWPKLMSKHTTLMNAYRDALSYLGEPALQFLVRNINRNALAHSDLGIRLESRHAPSIYAERLEAIKKGKSKTKSCQHCNHRFETAKLNEWNVIFCSACSKHDPFGNATFTKKLDVAKKKMKKAHEALEASHNALMAKCPYEHQIIHVYPDDDYSNMSNDPDTDPFALYRTPICEMDSFIKRGLDSLLFYFR